MYISAGLQTVTQVVTNSGTSESGNYLIDEQFYVAKYLVFNTTHFTGTRFFHLYEGVSNGEFLCITINYLFNVILSVLTFFKPPLGLALGPRLGHH